MLGFDDALFGYLLIIGLAVGAFSTVLTWVVRRRYGRWQAMTVPLMAVVAVGYMLWRMQALGGQEAMNGVAAAAIVVGPALAGSFLGSVLARPRDK